MRAAIMRFAKRLFLSLGYDVHRNIPSTQANRPAGDMASLLEGLRERGLQPSAILDVGAFRAQWSQEAQRVFPQADFFLIEPQAECEQPLKSFCQRHPGSRYFLVGAGAKPGNLPFAIGEHPSGSSFLQAGEVPCSRSGKERTVPVVTLDSLVAEGQIPIPQLAKMDVQGYELEALCGAEQMFGAVEVFILETSLYRFAQSMPLLHEVVAFMAARDYVVFDFLGFMRRPYDHALAQVDVCFVRQGGPFHCSDRW